MEIFIAPTGSVQELELAGTVAGKSNLGGSVRRSRGSSGRTALPSIIGAAGVQDQTQAVAVCHHDQCFN